MSLGPGQRLGPYEVLGSLGAGGMGQVWHARDTRLGREVALKVLPDELAGSAERRSRLEHEARLLASLNHPRIAALHDVLDFEGSPVLVMELVGGETLTERLSAHPKGPLARRPTEAQNARRCPAPIRSQEPAGKPPRRAQGRSVRSPQYSRERAVPSDVPLGGESCV